MEKYLSATDMAKLFNYKSTNPIYKRIPKIEQLEDIRYASSWKMGKRYSVYVFADYLRYEEWLNSPYRSCREAAPPFTVKGAVEYLKSKGLIDDEDDEVVAELKEENRRLKKTLADMKDFFEEMLKEMEGWRCGKQKSSGC